MDELLNNFADCIRGRLGIALREYQKHVAYEILKSIEKGHKFIIVSMPTGSGKTPIEMFTAFYGFQYGIPRILVLEPTRFLCDQMHGRGRAGGLWSRVFGDIVGKEYEGNCNSFLEAGKKIIISTPQTGLKCTSILKEDFKMIIIDEVHHAFGGKYYTELLMELNPDVIVGFTALLPSYRRYRLDPRVKSVIGEPHLLTYDFVRLEKIDPNFKPPKATADLFDAEMNELEDKAYNALFRAIPQGDPKIIKFLELTLARYGKDSFCESYKRAIERDKIIPNRELNELCNSREPAHKARMLIDVLTVYGVKENNELKPVLVFTSRKATAREFQRTITNQMGFSKKEIAVLTSDMSKEERLELVKKAKNGEVNVIISTLVGEEGLDIPEASLLVMTDVPKSPLRLYQRLGRLIRMAGHKKTKNKNKEDMNDKEKQHKLKYLAVLLTPETVEYLDLEDALWNLYSEGVDVSYILVNIKEETPSSRILNILNEFSHLRSDIAIQYTLLAFGWELSNPLTYITEFIKKRRELAELVRKHMIKCGFTVRTEEDLDTGVYYLLTFHMFRWGDVNKVLKSLDNAINRSRFSKEFSRAILGKKIFYIYDVGMVSEIVSYQLQELYQLCISNNRCINKFFRIDRKSILRLFTRAFPYNNTDNVIRKLQKRLVKNENILEEAKQRGILQDYGVRVKWGEYNEQNKSYSPIIIMSLRLENAWFQQYAQINYFDISREIYEDKSIRELIKANLLAIGYEALMRFLENSYERRK
ncbi:MAG: DEAD/DEAH box helicase [Caldisphaeraceae archaeon]|nr:DEAD/DEAH box helicase [Desulfurococcales archaeon]MEB3798242.1 DEAD/DEAH box helicase [Caldisphaeraceae archaeon]